MGTDLRESLGGDDVPRGQSPLLWSSLRRAIRAQPPDDGPVRVLDCGGGSGSLAVPMAVGGAQLTVVDVSIDALATLMRRATEAGVSHLVTPVQGDVEALGDFLPAGEFDLVMAHGVLEDVANVTAAMAEIARMPRSGGTVSLVTGNPAAVVLARALAGDVTGALSALRTPANEAAGPAALAAWCESAGLLIESIEGLGVFSELVPGIDLERPGAMAALAELEAAVATARPYRDIATKVHIVARRPTA